MTRDHLVWLLPLAVVAFLGVARTDEPSNKPPEGFTAIYNGKDLEGWKVHGGDMKLWGADADTGLLFCKGGGGGWLMTEKEYGDYELRVDWKIPEKGNSGVALRAPRQGDPAYSGMEIQILDNEWHQKNLKGLRDVQLTGAIYGVVPPSKDVTKPIGDWNTYRITAKGRKITIELNGTVIVDADLDEHKDQFKEHPGLTREKGCIGLQSHSERVEFRNVFVKEL
jgi:hypothetical protein